MKPYIKEYFKFFGYTEADQPICECCGTLANAVHHIHPRQRGGTDSLDIIENLMALCALCHLNYGDKKHYKSWLYKKHEDHLLQTGKPYKMEWIERQIKKW